VAIVVLPVNLAGSHHCIHLVLHPGIDPALTTSRTTFAK
jgi:hypothetical protein